MARIALTAILLFAIPFLVYTLYVAARGRKAAMDKAPVRGLIVAGIVCAVAGVIGFAILTQSGPNYVPPVGENSTLERPAQPAQ